MLHARLRRQRLAADAGLQGGGALLQQRILDGGM